MPHYDAIIIGGGASGLMAACALIRRGQRVAVLEKQARVGRKLLSTGNGRCNLTHRGAAPSDYHGGVQAVRQALRQYPPTKIEALFGELGIPCVADAEGRVYPASRQAASVLDALRLCCHERGVETLTEFGAVSLKQVPGGFEAASQDGRRVRGRCALVCTGGLAAPKLGACGDGYELLKSFGHRIAPRFPAIAPLKTAAEPIRGLKGIRAEGELSLLDGEKIIRTEAGEILFTETGVSGIAAMQLARQANEVLRAGRKCAVRLRLSDESLTERARNLPERCMEDFLNGIVARRLGQSLAKAAGIELNRAAGTLTPPERCMEDFLNGIVARRLGQSLAKAAGIELNRAAGTLTPPELHRLEAVLSGWTLPVTATAGFDQAQVTAGGASLKDFDIRTLQSLRAPGLFAAGEVLDVDGDCGGYNLQWAWASALLAAEGISQYKRSVTP